MVHIRLLEKALKGGYILRKVHKLIQFKQSHWLKLYIHLNTKFRADSSSDFEKELNWWIFNIW